LPLTGGASIGHPDLVFGWPICFWGWLPAVSAGNVARRTLLRRTCRAMRSFRPRHR